MPLTNGETQDSVTRKLGKPEKISKTVTGFIQWTYTNPNPPKEVRAEHKKTWIVFDKVGKVSGIYRYYVCFLTI